MKRPTVYLCGLISTDAPESLQWRLDVTSRLSDAGFEVLSPMRSKDPNQLIKGGLTDPNITSKDIILRDFNDVKRASVILAHLEIFGGFRPLLGTVAELAWAWQFNTPVVGIALPDNFYMRNHPFVREFISHYCEDVESAVDFVLHYYCGGK